MQAQIDVRTLQLSQTHPRYLTNADGKQVTRDLIENEPWAKEVFDKLKAKADSYTRLTEAQPDWLLSRLAMYWNSHATDVYIKGESFDHAGGTKAPVPTVRYTGTRGTFATHGRPKLADVIPYDDDKDGNVTFHNNSLPGKCRSTWHIPDLLWSGQCKGRGQISSCTYRRNSICHSKGSRYNRGRDGDKAGQTAWI